jgi:hypothetical protein
MSDGVAEVVRPVDGGRLVDRAEVERDGAGRVRVELAGVHLAPAAALVRVEQDVAAAPGPGRRSAGRSPGRGPTTPELAALNTIPLPRTSSPNLLWYWCVVPRPRDSNSSAPDPPLPARNCMFFSAFSRTSPSVDEKSTDPLARTTIWWARTSRSVPGSRSIPPGAASRMRPPPRTISAPVPARQVDRAVVVDADERLAGEELDVAVPGVDLHPLGDRVGHQELGLQHAVVEVVLDPVEPVGRVGLLGDGEVPLVVVERVQGLPHRLVRAEVGGGRRADDGPRGAVRAASGRRPCGPGRRRRGRRTCSCPSPGRRRRRPRASSPASAGRS